MVFHGSWVSAMDRGSWNFCNFAVDRESWVFAVDRESFFGQF